jgi:hypothetical protein
MAKPKIEIKGISSSELSRRKFLNIKNCEGDKKRPDVLGNWRFIPESLVLYNQEAAYEVDLEDMINAVDVLDWIFQISGKPDNDFDLGNFVKLLDMVITYYFKDMPQAVFCHAGCLTRVNWKRKSFQPL